MKLRTTLLALAVAGSLAAPIGARAANFSIDVEVAPPPPIHEELPYRESYIVMPGYYRFDSDTHKHVWVHGHYERERRGEHYVAPEWHEEHGRYHLREGHWDRD